MIFFSLLLLLLFVLVIARFLGPRARMPLTVSYAVVIIALALLPFVSGQPLTGILVIVMTLPSSLLLWWVIQWAGLGSSEVMNYASFVLSAIVNIYLFWLVIGLVQRRAED